jgi:cysteine desulfurase/selenocysteine lyase
MKTGKSGPIEAGPGPPASEPEISTSPWRWWRDRMPITSEWAYFDHAAVAPLSLPAAQASHNFADQAAEFGDTVWPQWAAKVEHLRTLMAQLLGCDSAEVCMVPNTTTGINLVAEGWPWRPGDNVIVPEGEFPSNLFPWQNQQSRGVEVRVVPRRGDEILVEDLIARVDDATRIISVSWVGYASGFRLDIDALVQAAHSRGVFVFLDAIQGLGMYPLDLSKTPVDFLAADGHKWLLGAEGAGIAMIRAEHLDRLRCGNVGWSSVKNAYNYGAPSFELRDDARRFEAGSANMIGTAALTASLEMFSQVREHHGDDAIASRVIGLTESLDELLRAEGAITRLPKSPANRSGILTFTVPGVEPAEVRRRAFEQKVVVSCRDGGVRASIHVYNDADDLARLVDVVRSCSRSNATEA